MIIENSGATEEKVMVNTGAEGATGSDFLEIASPKLFKLFQYVRTLIADGNYDQANWTITLRGDERNAPPEIKRLSREIEKKYGLKKPEEDYLRKRKRLEERQPITASVKEGGILSNMLLRIIHLPAKKR